MNLLTLPPFSLHMSYRIPVDFAFCSDANSLTFIAELYILFKASDFLLPFCNNYSNKNYDFTPTSQLSFLLDKNHIV